MAKSQSGKPNRILASCVFAAGLALAGGLSDAQRAKAAAAAPDFYQDGIGWIANGNDFQPPKSGIGPVTSDPAHPYIANGGPNGGPTFRVSDLSHPALMPWVKDTLKKL